MKKYNIILSILFFIFIVYMIVNIKESKDTTFNTLITFSKNILPSLLPFLILNQLLIKLGVIDFFAYLFQFISYPVFKISGKGASIILMGILNGFPSSAIYTSLMFQKKEINKEEAQRLINFIFFPSLSFLFSILKTNINNSRLFVLLALSIYLTGFTFLYISSFKIKEDVSILSFHETLENIKTKQRSFSLAKDIKHIISYSFNTLLNILGIITLFSIPCLILDKILPSTISIFFQGLIEFSIPSIKISNIIGNKKRIVLTLVPILSFSSISSIMQANLFIQDVTLNSKSFIFSRILVSICSLFILFLFLFCLQ